MKRDDQWNRRMPAARRAVLALCLASLSMGAGQMLAQDAAQQSQQQPGEAGQQGGRPTPEQMVDHQMHHLTKALNLTSAQETQIRPILTEQMTQMMALRQNTQMAQADKHDQMMKIRTDSEGKIREALSSTQQAQYNELLEQQRQHMGRNHGGYQGGQGDGQNGQTAPPQQ